MKEIRVWIDKIRGTIDSAQFKNKPLRDQLNLCEKYLAEINGQKTRITLSVEKLQVIFDFSPTHNDSFFFISFFIAKYKATKLDSH